MFFFNISPNKDSREEFAASWKKKGIICGKVKMKYFVQMPVECYRFFNANIEMKYVKFSMFGRLAYLSILYEM